MVGVGQPYILGTGDYNVGKPGITEDTPWTWRKGYKGSDCAGFAICWAWKLRRHRVGFNVGPWASVSDDINCDSAYEDGLHQQALFITLPPNSCIQPGDLILYPSVWVNGVRFIGHVGLIESVPVGWKWGDWGPLSIIQCKGPNNRTPAVVRTDGATWVRRDQLWSKPHHRTNIVRVKERL